MLACSFLLSLAAACKLPFVLYFIFPWTSIAIEYLRSKNSRELLRNLFTCSLFMIIPFLWYVFAIPEWRGHGVVHGVLHSKYNLSETVDYLKDNLFSILPELLLNYGSLVFFLAGFYFIFKNQILKRQYFLPWLTLGAALISYFLYEINIITNVHDYYVFPFLRLLFVIVSYGASQMLASKKSL